MNHIDRPSCSKMPDPVQNPPQISPEMLDLVNHGQDNEDLSFIAENGSKQDNPNNLDDSMLKAIEQWRNYGKRKLSKLDLQHEDDLEFYKFASNLLASDEDCMDEFQTFVTKNQEERSLGSDSYCQMDCDVSRLLNKIYFESSPVIKGLFANVCIWVNGWTYPVAKTLHSLVRLTGGDFCLTYNPHKVTHIISTVISMSNLKSEKHQQNTVNPEWIIDSLKDGKVLPLFDYRVLRPKNDIKRMFEKQYKKNRAVVQADRPSNDNESAKEATKNETVNPKPCPSSSVPETDGNSHIPKKLSDIDGDILNSLPPEIVEELEQHFKSASPQICDLPKPKPQQQTFLVSHVKAQKKNISIKKPAITSKSTNQTKIDDLIKRRKDPDSRINDLFCGKYDRKLGPNLCGITDDKEINLILENWILEYDTLQDSDLTYFLRFIASLIDANQQKQLFDILSTVRDLISQRIHAAELEVDSWTTFFYETIQKFLECESDLASKIPPEIFNQ